ncbi:MAG: winged helix DNA-binding domain-containing protein [Prevotella sp.]
MNPTFIRQLNQSLICSEFNSPEEVVDYMGAMQAQDYRMMRWAVAMRTQKPSMLAFKKAFDDGNLIRLHLMRGTWQLISAKNYWWLLELFAPRAISIIRGWMRSNKIEISEKELMKIREFIALAAEENGCVCKEDIVRFLKKKDIELNERCLSYHIRFAELTGTICSGELLPNKSTYALVSARIKTANLIERDEALMRIARLYFKSRQPATLEDFVWWTGLTISDCRKAVRLLGNYLHKQEFFGQEFYLTDDCKTQGSYQEENLLISPYDEYLISYKSRYLVLAEEYKHKAHNNNGIFQPIIAHKGIICGNWKPNFDDLQPSFFFEEHSGSLQKEIHRYKDFLLK